MLTNLEIIDAAKQEFKTKLDVISEIEKQLDGLKSDAIDIVSAATEKLNPDDKDSESDVRREIRRMARSLGFTMTGDDYGHWSPGEPIEFWIPSTC